MLEFNGQRWIVRDCALTVSFPLQSCTWPEAWWSLDVGAQPAQAHAPQADLRLAIHPLFASVRHWRELQNLELKIDSAWQDTHEFVNEEGEVQWTEAEARWWPDRAINKARYWLGDRLTLRFGSWDNDKLFCEVEGRLEAEEHYYRDPPGARVDSPSADDTVNYLLMAQARIARCEIEVPGQVRDPLSWARAKAHEHLAFRSFGSVQARRIGAEHGAFKVILEPPLAT